MSNPDVEIKKVNHNVSVCSRVMLGGLALAALAACQQQSAAPEKRPVSVRSQTVEFIEYAPTAVLTGEIRARVENDLSFRTSGRIVERTTDVGSHVTADQVIARIDPNEQQANLDGAQATFEAAHAQLRLASTTFERQKTLLAQGFTTRREYDQAEEAFRTAQGSLDAATAQLAAAKDQLSYTMLRAGVSGVIIARHAEIGHVVQAAEPVFKIAQDGVRDAVFNVYESLLNTEPVDRTVEIALVSNAKIKAIGSVREIAPTVDPATGTVRVKIGIEEPSPAMELGAAVTGTGRIRPRKAILLPWSALSSLQGRPAVWVVDPQTKAVSLKPIKVDRYDTGRIVVVAGLDSGQIVVTAGAQFLRPNQPVVLVGQVVR